MTEKQIIKILARSIDDRKYPFQIPNAFFYGWECDYWVLSAQGETKEFEIKVTRADFVKDAKKAKHNHENGANYFYYVCPFGLISKEEINPKYGLIYIVNNRAEIVKKPKKLHTGLFCKWQDIAVKSYWRFWNLWREKYIEKEITAQEYNNRAFLNLECFSD